MSTRLQDLYAQLSSDGFSPTTSPPTLLDGTTEISGAGTYYSVPLWIASVDFYRFAYFGGASDTLDATLSLQCSIDHARNAKMQPVAADLLNWVPVNLATVSAGSITYVASFAVSGASYQAVGDETRCNYLWVRAKLVVSSGAGAPSLRFCLKGEGGR